MIASSCIILKKEFPNLTKSQIIEYFLDKLELEGIYDKSSNSDGVEFVNQKSKLSFAGGRNKFIGFDKGSIRIVENEYNFTLKFSSSSKKTYLLFAKISMGLLVLASLVSGFTFDSFLIGVAAFIIFSAEYTIHTYFNINSYISSLSVK